jgi:hypothetical protein
MTVFLPKLFSVGLRSIDIVCSAQENNNRKNGNIKYEKPFCHLLVPKHFTLPFILLSLQFEETGIGLKMPCRAFLGTCMGHISNMLSAHLNHE